MNTELDRMTETEKLPAWVTELVEAAKDVVEADWFLPAGKFVSANANDPLEWSEEVTWLIEACNKLDAALTAALEGGK